MAFRYLLIIVKRALESSPLYHTFFSCIFFYFSFFFPFSYLSDRRSLMRCAGQASCFAFVRELNVEHSFFNERFAILISRINLVVSRHRELRGVKNYRVCAECAHSSLYTYLYIKGDELDNICIYIYIRTHIHVYTHIYIYFFFLKLGVEHLVRGRGREDKCSVMTAPVGRKDARKG